MKQKKSASCISQIKQIKMATVLTAESRRLSTLGNAWPQGIYKVVFKLPKSIISRIFFTVYFTIITCVIIFGFFSGLLLCFKTKKRKCFSKSVSVTPQNNHHNSCLDFLFLLISLQKCFKITKSSYHLAKLLLMI